MRIAATADLHVRVGDEARIRDLFADVRHAADALVLAGDLTEHGRPVEAETLLRGLDGVGVPVLAVLGNHDHEGGTQEDVLRLLQSAGVHCLEHGTYDLGDVGFAGVKGFGGGFGVRLVRGFGEAAVKAFVSESILQAEALRAALRSLRTPRRVAVMHYAPVVETTRGEPPEIEPFLGTTRLAEAVDDGGATLVIHGHAHRGAIEGRTPGGVPVYNVSMPALHAAGIKEAYRVLDVPSVVFSAPT
jgi:Icc-related predicted phosphoesterase